MDEFKVKTTTFRFPSIPDDAGRGGEIAAERRDKILAAARKVGPFKAPKSKPRTSLLDTRMPVPAGHVFQWFKGQPEGPTGTVQMPGPVGSSVWVSRNDTGEWAAVKFSPKYGFVGLTAETERAKDQRAVIVTELADRDGGYCRAVREYRHLTSFRSDPARVVAAFHRMEAERARALWSAWQSAYPNAPFAFDLVPNRSDLDKRFSRTA